MATVDTKIRFGRYNSLKLAPGEESWSLPFDVALYSSIAIQAQALSLTGEATGLLTVKWLTEDGKKITDDMVAFDIGTRWSRKTATEEVPESADRAMFAVKNTSNSRYIHIACAMTEAGEVASAFDPSLASQAAYLNAHGLYVGKIYAHQIELKSGEGFEEALGDALTLLEAGEALFVKYTDLDRPSETIIDGGNMTTGRIKSSDEKMVIDLDSQTIEMTGSDAKWIASPANPLRIQDNAGKFLGGAIKRGAKVFFAANGFATSDDPEYIIVAGDVTYLDDSLGAGIYTFHKNNLNIPVVAVEMMGDDNSSGISIKTAKHTFEIDDEGTPDTFRLWNYYQPGVGGYFIYGNPGEFHIEVQTHHATPRYHALGIDATGPYYMVNGTIKRLT